MTGSYPDLSSFLKDLYSLQRIIVIDRIDILPPTDQDTTVLNMSVAMRAFAFGVDLNAKKLPGAK